MEAAREAAAQQQVEVAQHRLAADDEDPGVHDGVERVEAERRQVAAVVSERVDGVDEARDLRRRRRRRRRRDRDAAAECTRRSPWV